MTGYRIHYVAGGVAVPLIKPFPKYGFEGPPLTWWQKFRGVSARIRYSDSEGLAVTYKSNRASFAPAGNSRETQILVPDFIAPTFQPDGRTYRQLTPDGVLPVSDSSYFASCPAGAGLSGNE